MKKFTFFIAVSIFLVFNFFPLHSGHAPGALVTTMRGGVEIEKVSFVDGVVGFNDQADSPADALIESNINELHYDLHNKYYVISLDEEDLYVSADQKFYDLTTASWVKAKNLNLNSVLIDIYGNQHQCLDINVYDEPYGMYDISIDEPHLYFTGATQILTHNVIPVVVLPVAAVVTTKTIMYTTVIAGTLWTLFQHGRHNGWFNNHRRQPTHNRLDSHNEQESTSNVPDPEDPKKDNEEQKDRDTKETKSPERKECKYKDTTKGDSVPNARTDVPKEEVAQNLREDGWQYRKSNDGKTDIYTKDGKSYTLRDNARSTGGPTADYRKNAGSKDADVKIRLGDSIKPGE